MALDYSDKKLNRYFDALFVVGKMGDAKKELAGLQRTLCARDMAELIEFQEKYKDIISLVSRDEEEGATASDLKKLEEYEKLTDDINIAQPYKVKMYDCILVGVDKFEKSRLHSLSLLEKITVNTPNKEKDNLKRLQKCAMQYRFGVEDSYEKLIKKIELKLKNKDPDIIEESRKRFNIINNMLGSRISDQKRIDLLHEQLELVDKCNFGRMRTFQTKAAVCHDLSNEYACAGNIANQEQYIRDSRYYQKLVQNIKDHTGRV